VPVRKGLNRLSLLSDHLGRWFNGKPDLQGLRGAVYLGARRLDLSEATAFGAKEVCEEAFRGMVDCEFCCRETLLGVALQAGGPDQHAKAGNAHLGDSEPRAPVEPGSYRPKAASRWSACDPGQALSTGPAYDIVQPHDSVPQVATGIEGER